MSNAPTRADAARLASVSTSQALRFRGAFAETDFLPPSGDDIPEVLELRARGGRNLPRLLHLTAAERPLDILARLFLLGAAVDIKAARRAMSSVPLEEWCEAGLVKINGDFVEGLVAISLFEGFLLASEKPEVLERGADSDYVCTVTNSTATLGRFMIRRPFDHVLDLCTGCGVLGFIAARQGGCVVATDLNPRAIQFAIFNSRLNGISNVEFAVGDTFDPVRGRKFDLITANPPCVLGPSARYRFRDSGQELDSLCRRIVSEAPAYLNEGGIFQSTLEWPNIGKDDWKKRISEYVHDSGHDALVLHLRTKNVKSHADETVCDTDILDCNEQVKLYSSYMDYFQRHDVTSISEGIIALRRRSGPSPNWVRLENLSSHSPKLYGDAVSDYFAVSDTLDRLGDDLFESRPRMSPSISVEIVHTWDGNSWEEDLYRVRQGSGFGFEAVLDLRIADLIRSCDGTKTLRELADRLAASAQVPFDSIAQGCFNVVREMIRRGFLTISG